MAMEEKIPKYRDEKDCRYEMNPVAEEYMWNVKKDLANLCIKSITFFKHAEILEDFRDYVAVNQGLSPGEIVQGVNEINLSVNLYNVMNAQGSRN